jgi:cell division protein FtsA
MRDPASVYFVGLDIGTAYTRCVVGSPDAQSSSGRPSIIGHGSAPNLGMRRGAVVHVDDVAEAIAHAVTEAERISGKEIKGATVNLNGAHVSGMNSKGVIAISTANREITLQDRLRVEEAATIIQLPANREIIQAFTKNYAVDGQHNIKDPVGMQGVRLEADMHLVTAASPNAHNLDLALQKAQLTANHHTVSGLAAAEAVLNRQQKEVGTAVIDIGAGTTNLVVIEDGEIQHVAVIPMGGNDVTNDLAIVLKIDLDVAEMAKVRYGDFLSKATMKISHDREDYIFETEHIKMIVEARVEELFEYVDKELQKIRRSRKLPGGIVIVGGSAKLPNIAAVSKEKLQLASRVGQLYEIGGLIDTVAQPSFYTATGLMMLDMLLGEEPKESLNYSGGGNPFSLVDSLWRKFKRS